LPGCAARAVALAKAGRARDHPDGGFAPEQAVEIGGT
jgi:hypothetical protein